MDESLIYRKTRRGATELTATHGALSSPARRVLILLDGERTLAELAELFGAESVEHIVAELEAQGFVRQVDPDNELTTQALTTQTLSTLIGEPNLAPIEAPPSRRGSMWAALGLLVAALATAGGGYWFFLRPKQATEPIFAVAGTGDTERVTVAAATADRIVADTPGPSVLPLTGLPAVTVSQTKKASAAEAAAAGEVIPAAAVVPAAAPLEAPAPPRRQAERATPDRAANDHGTSDRGSATSPASVLEAAKAALETSSPPESGAASAAVQALTARSSVAQPGSAPPAPTGGSPSAASGSPAVPAGAMPQASADQPPPATVMTVGANPALPNASKGAPLGEQVASLAPPPRPKSGPVQLHQRKHDPPEYPVRAVRAKIFEGHVLARIWVTPEGNVDQVDIVKATPPRVFDEEVKRALTAWTFDPPGHPVDTTVELDFKP